MKLSIYSLISFLLIHIQSFFMPNTTNVDPNFMWKYKRYLIAELLLLVVYEAYVTTWYMHYRYIRDTLETYMKYNWNVYEKCLRYTLDTTEIYQRYAWYMYDWVISYIIYILEIYVIPEIHLRYEWDMTQICVIYAWDIPENWNIPKIYLRYASQSVSVFPKYRAAELG